MRAVGTTVEGFIGLDAVTDNLAPTVVADRSELVNRTLEAIKRVSGAGGNNFKRQVIVVSAYFTLRHISSPCAAGSLVSSAQVRQRVPRLVQSQPSLAPILRPNVGLSCIALFISFLPQRHLFIPKGRYLGGATRRVGCKRGTLLAGNYGFSDTKGKENQKESLFGITAQDRQYS